MMQGPWEVSETGQNLVFATYLGGKGSQNEPHILYVNTGHISSLNYIGMDIYTHTHTFWKQHVSCFFKK